MTQKAGLASLPGDSMCTIGDAGCVECGIYTAANGMLVEFQTTSSSSFEFEFELARTFYH